MEHLAPGGWIEQVEMSVTPVSDDGSIPPGHIFQRWGDISLEAGEQFGKTLRIHEQAKGLMEEAGFTEVREVVFKWPIGPWSRDPHLKQVGLWNQLHWEEGIEGWSIALLTRVLGVRPALLRIFSIFRFSFFVSSVPFLPRSPSPLQRAFTKVYNVLQVEAQQQKKNVCR
jgi:hypothetical protein